MSNLIHHLVIECTADIYSVVIKKIKTNTTCCDFVQNVTRTRTCLARYYRAVSGSDGHRLQTIVLRGPGAGMA